MNLNKLKAKMDDFFGLESYVGKVKEHEASLVYESPTGIILFEIQISIDSGECRFGSMSNSVANLYWHKLFDMHRQEENNVE